MWSGLWQMSLDLVCVALSATIGIEDQLQKTLISTTVAGLLLGLLFLGEQFSGFKGAFNVQTDIRGYVILQRWPTAVVDALRSGVVVSSALVNFDLLLARKNCATSCCF